MGPEGIQPSDAFTAAEIRILPLPGSEAAQPTVEANSPQATGPVPYWAELNVDQWRGFRPATVHIDFATLLTLSEDADRYGQALGRMIFASDGLRTPYGSALSYSHGKMRVRLRLEPTELHGLHWERIYHPLNAHWLPLSSTADTPLSRFVLAQQWDHPLPVERRDLRLLAVISSPSNAGRYDLDPITPQEREALHAVLDALPGVETTYLESDMPDTPTLPRLRQALGSGYHLVHFLCHGARTPFGTVLYLENEDGRVKSVTQDKLIEAFRAVAERPALTFLAACESASRTHADAVTSLGHALVEDGGVRAVVAMTGKVAAGTAQVFSAGFYERLLDHGIVDLAVNQARTVVRDTWDWGAPVLFSRLADNCLIEEPAGVMLARAGRAATMAELLRRRRQREDWGEARRGERLWGRDVESAQLREWIEVERCRLIGVYGLGGMGKTALATSVGKEVQNGFECVYWRSLQNEYKPEEYLRHSIQFILREPPAALPDDFESLLAVFVAGLQERRCLLILDNMETVLESGQRAGTYRAGYAGYGKLLESVASTEHDSCIIVTSREKVPEIRAAEQGPVRALELTGLDAVAAREVVLEEDSNLLERDEDWPRLVEICGGIPLALKLVADYVRRFFGGDLGQFLNQSQGVIQGLEDVLRQQIDRLGPLERQVLTWLAIEREPVTIDDLQEDILTGSGRDTGDLMATMMSLQRRSLVESRPGGRFGLQPVVMEFVIQALVEQIGQEIEEDSLDSLAAYALSKARSKDYVRDIQIRLILSPVAERLQEVYGQEAAVRKLTRLLDTLRQVDPLVTPRIHRGYAAANCLNLLRRLDANLARGDFSGAVVRQADLQQAALQDASFADATFESCFLRSNFTGIISIAFDPTGGIMATGTSAGETWLWKIDPTFPQAGQLQPDSIHSVDLIPLRVLEGHTDMVHAVSFRSDGALLATGSEDGTVGLWEVETGRLLWRTAAHANQVYTVAFSPDNATIASGGDNCDVQIWDAATGTCAQTLTGHDGWLRSVAFNADGTLLASGSDDHTVRVWDVRRGQTLHTLAGHPGAVRWVRFAPHGDVLTSTSTDQMACFWNTRSGERLDAVLRDGDEQIGRVIFAGEDAVSFGDEHTVRLWNLSDGRALASLTSPHRINVADLSPDSRLLAFGGEDHTVQLWEVGTGQCLRVLHGYSNWLKAIVYSGDGRFFASCGDDKVMRLWDASTAECLRTFTGHAGHIRSVALNPDGSLLASCSDDGTIQLWEPGSGRSLRTLRGHSNRVWDVVFSPDGRWLASASFDLSVRLWEVETGRGIRVFEGHSGQVRSVAFSPDGAALASSGDDRDVRLWDVATGRTLHVMRQHTDVVWDVAFSHDGRLLASASGDDTICLWMADNGELLDTLRGHIGSVWSVAFSPDGTWLASAGSDRTVRLWPVGRWTHSLLQRLGLRQLTRRLARVQTPQILEGHTDFVRAVAFHPAGHILASCGHDGAIQLWNLDRPAAPQRLRADRPYERMDITGTSGLTVAQHRALKALGAIERSEGAA